MDSNQLKEKCSCEHCMNKERQIKQAGDHWKLIKLNLKAQQCKTCLLYTSDAADDA